MQENIVKIKETISSGNLCQLIGLIEGEHLECKGQPYDLTQEFNKRELAKDVASFANAEGGLIIIGAKTVKSQLHIGDEIEKIRPFEQSLLNPDQYHKILREWIYPAISNIDIRFHKEASSEKGIVVIDISKQDQNHKPFLIKKMLEQQKIVETMFGYAERKRGDSQPLSAVDLQTMLRKGLRYEENLERQFKLDSLPAFRAESLKAKQLAIETPDYWQYLLAEELLRPRFRQLREELSDLEKGAVLGKHQKLDVAEFWNWFEVKWPEAEGAVKVIAGCVNEKLSMAWGQSGDQGPDAVSIFRAVSRLHAGCSALLDWETDVFRVHPPANLEPLRNVMLGSTREILDELAPLPDHLAEAVQKHRNYIGSEPLIHHVPFELRYSRAKLICDVLEQLATKSHH